MVAVRIIAGILCGLLALSAQADDTVNQDSGLAVIKNAGGLIVQIPVPASADLLSQVRRLRSSLLDRQLALGEMVEEARFDAADTLLSVILPGGLIYASYRKLSSDRAQARLESVNEELSNLSRGLLALQAANGKTLLVLLD